MTGAIEVLVIRKLDGVRRPAPRRRHDQGLQDRSAGRQKAWLAMPSVKTERAWQNVVELTKPLRERVTEVVLAAWATHQPEPPARAAPGEAWSRPDAAPLETTPIPPDGDECPF